MKLLLLLLLQISFLPCFSQPRYSTPDSLELIWHDNYIEKTKSCWQSFSVKDAIKAGVDSACSLILFNDSNSSSPYIYLVSNELGNLTELKEMEVASNIKLVIFPKEIGKLKKLETLWLFSNINEHSLPSQFKDCDGLISLGLVGDSIFFENLPELISGLKGLKFLTLQMQNHKSLKVYKSLYKLNNQNLKVLHLRNFHFSPSKKRRIKKFYSSKGCNVLFY
jgi:hypothetical protein